MDSLVADGLKAIAEGRTADQCEGPRLDFKQDRASFDHTAEKLVEACTCLANADGGFIVLGVADKVRGPEAFTGTERDGEPFRKKVREWTTPPLEVGVEEIQWEGARLLIFQVLRSAIVHQDRQGAVRRRFQKDCYRLGADQIASLQRTKSGHDWSGEPSADTCTIEEGSYAALRALLRKRPPAEAKLADASAEELLRGLGVVDGRDRLLNGGVLLALPQPQTATPRVIYQYRPSAAGEARRVEYLREPIPALLDRLVGLVRQYRNTTPFTFPNGQQIELSDFPEEAVREAISNAVLHREYALDEPINVEHTPGSLVVHSPGSFVDGISSENVLTHPSRPRNRCLFGAAQKLGLSEHTGRGIDRMYRELLRAGQEPPDIADGPNAVRVSFLSRRPRTELLGLVDELPESMHDDLDVLLTLTALLSRRTISAEELGSLAQKRPDETLATLETLALPDVAAIEPTSHTAGNRYPRYKLTARSLRRLGRAVPYHRQQPRDLDRKVLAHLADYGWINNRTLQTLFDVDLAVARRRLDALRRKGLIEKLDGPERGPGVRYGPGPNAFTEDDGGG